MQTLIAVHQGRKSSKWCVALTMPLTAINEKYRWRPWCVGTNRSVSLARVKPGLDTGNLPSMIIYKSRFLTRAEVWFDHQPTETANRVDWILYHQRSRPVAGAKSRGFYTLLIDLSQSEEQLLAELTEETAYKIRRARERDKIICECCDPRDQAVMSGFEHVYRTFAAMKGLPTLNRARLNSLADAGVLDMSAAKDPQGNVLVYHANY